MIALAAGFAAAAVALGAYCWLLARSWRAVGAYVVLLAVLYGAGLELLSRPKSTALEWRTWRDPEVLAYALDEPRAIYVWIRGEGPTPRAYALPWSLETAQQLVEAEASVAETGGRLGTAMFTHRSLDDQEPMFYGAPPPALPPKQGE